MQKLQNTPWHRPYFNQITIPEQPCQHPSKTFYIFQFDMQQEMMMMMVMVMVMMVMMMMMMLMMVVVVGCLMICFRARHGFAI